jgi:hypothetical protein
MSAEAKNLKAIQAAIVQHNGSCGEPILEIRMNPFEVERLDWEDFMGIPIKADDELGTGCFRLICSGQHGEAPAGVQTISDKPRIGEMIPV